MMFKLIKYIPVQYELADRIQDMPCVILELINRTRFGKTSSEARIYLNERACAAHVGFCGAASENTDRQC